VVVSYKKKEKSTVASYTPPTITSMDDAALAIAAAIVPKLVTAMSQADVGPVESKQGVANTLVTHPDGSQTTVPEMIDKPTMFKGPTCEVGFSAGLTLNLGSYQSARIDVSVRIPCSHGEIDQVYDFARAWVDKRLAKEQDIFQQANAPDKK
jgi:hypothetical protein